MPVERRYLLLLGSNIDRNRSVREAHLALSKLGEIEAVSAVYASAAVGAPGTPEFHNQALLLRAPLKRSALRDHARKIEADLGRVRAEDPNAPRTIDIDIVYEIESERAVEFDEDLPKLHHVALPAAEIDGHRTVQGSTTVQELADALGPPPEGFRRLPIDGDV